MLTVNDTNLGTTGMSVIEGRFPSRHVEPTAPATSPEYVTKEYFELSMKLLEANMLAKFKDLELAILRGQSHNSLQVEPPSQSTSLSGELGGFHSNELIPFSNLKINIENEFFQLPSMLEEFVYSQYEKEGLSKRLADLSLLIIAYTILGDQEKAGIGYEFIDRILGKNSDSKVSYVGTPWIKFTAGGPHKRNRFEIVGSLRQDVVKLLNKISASDFDSIEFGSIRRNLKGSAIGWSVFKKLESKVAEVVEVKSEVVSEEVEVVCTKQPDVNSDILNRIIENCSLHNISPPSLEKANLVSAQALEFLATDLIGEYVNSSAIRDFESKLNCSDFINMLWTFNSKYNIPMSTSIDDYRGIVPETEECNSDLNLIVTACKGLVSYSTPLKLIYDQLSLLLLSRGITKSSDTVVSKINSICDKLAATSNDKVKNLLLEETPKIAAIVSYFNRKNKALYDKVRSNNLIEIKTLKLLREILPEYNRLYVSGDDNNEFDYLPGNGNSLSTDRLVRCGELLGFTMRIKST